MYGIYINFGCRFEFRTQKIPYERILGNFSDFTNFGHFWILAVLQNIWDLHKFGLQIWIQNAKITLWKNFGQFFRSWISILAVFRFLHKFWSSGPYGISFFRCIRSGYAKKDHISILAVIQKIWDLHKFGLQIWIQNAKITLWKNFGQFFRFHRFWSSGPGMRKKIISQY